MTLRIDPFEETFVHWQYAADYTPEQQVQTLLAFIKRSCDSKEFAAFLNDPVDGRPSLPSEQSGSTTRAARVGARKQASYLLARAAACLASEAAGPSGDAYQKLALAQAAESLAKASSVIPTDFAVVADQNGVPAPL